MRLVATLLCLCILFPPGDSVSQNTAYLIEQAQTALADSSFNTIDGARKAIDRAIKLDPDNVAYLEVKLELMPSATKGFLPFLREQRRIDLANRILKNDSTSAVANEEIAIRAYREFREYHKAITFPRFRGAANPADLFDISWLRTQMTELNLSDRAGDNHDRAVSFFNRALFSDPTRESPYRWLASIFALQEDYRAFGELLKTMRINLPENPETWLYMGFVAFRDASQEDAERFFDRAFSLMNVEEVRLFHSVEPILGPDADRPRTSEITDHFWESRDPRLLTEINERKLEHYSRMVYADLAFGVMPWDSGGWDTGQGRIYVRYGEPLLDVVIRMDRGKGFFPGDDAESFNIWDYGDFKFVFDKPVEMVQYRSYSPAASAMTGPTTLAVNHDYVIISRNNIRRTPDLYEHDPDAVRVEFPYLVSRFKGADGRTDILISFGVQVPYKPRRGSLRMPLKTGAFLLTESTGIAYEKRQSVSLLESHQILEFEEATTWVDVHQFSALPGAYVASVEIESETGAIVGFHRSEVDAPNWGASDLICSDILLAYTIEEAGPRERIPTGFIERNDLIIQPAPWGVFSTNQPLYFYLEAYNLTIGSDGLSTYTMEAALVEGADEGGLGNLISKLFGGDSDEGVSVRFEGSSSSSDHGQYLILDTTDQAPGTYVLTVRFTDTISDKTVEKRRVLILE